LQQTYPEQFVVSTREFNAANVLTLNQTLAWDLGARRTFMAASFDSAADGLPTSVLEQVRFCLLAAAARHVKLLRRLKLKRASNGKGQREILCKL
jgi:hypothetical protein